MRFTLLMLRGHPTRIALAVASIALATAVTCAIGAVERSVVRAFSTVVEDIAGRTTLVVQAPGGNLFPEVTVNRISTVPGVATAVPVRIETATEPDGGEPVTVYVFDFVREPYLRVYDRYGSRMSYGDLHELIEAGDSVVVSEAFAARRGLQVGAPLVLDTPLGRRRFVVRRVLALEGLARLFGSSMVIMDPNTAAASFGDPSLVNRLDVVVRIREDVERVRDAVVRTLPNFEVYAPLARSLDLGRVVRSFQVLLWSVVALAVGLCSLVSFHALATHFEGQAWQAAVMRALGVRTPRVWWELMKQSLLLGAVGTSIGLPTGVALGHVLLPAVAAAASVSYRLAVSPSELVLAPWTLVLAASIGFGAAAATAALPTWLVSRSTVADALRQGRSNPRPVRGPTWALWVRVLTVATCVATFVVGRPRGRPIVSFAETALVALLTALSARPLLERLAPSLASLAERVVGGVAIFAGANLVDHARRTALALAVLGVGVGCVVWLRTVATSFERTLVDALGETLRADFVVASPRSIGGWVPAPVDPGILDRLRSVPEVRAVAANRLADATYRGSAIAINAFDDDYFAEPAFGRPKLLGASAPDVWRRLATGSGVLASTNLLLNFGLRVGDTIELETPGGRIGLPIVGAMVAFVSPAGTIEMSRALYERLWRDRQLNRVWVRTRDGVKPETARVAIVRAVGGAYGVAAFTAREMLDHLTAQARRAFAPVVVVESIVIILVLVGIGDALASAVLRQVRTIGTLRAVGLSARDVARMVVAEALVLAALGLLLGFTAGFALAALWVHATLPALLGWLVELHVPWTRLVLVAAATFAVATLAALLPARVAARLEATEALRYE